MEDILYCIGTAFPRISCYQINISRRMFGIVEGVQRRSTNNPEVVRQGL